MRHYEVLFILKPTLSEEELKEKLEFVKGVISSNGGEIASVVEMGARKLAYKIDKFERGVYYVIYFKSEPSLIEELVRNLRYNESIIRFLTVKYQNKQEIEAWEKLSKNIKLNNFKKQAPRKREYPQKEQNQNNENDFQEEMEKQEDK